MTIKYISPAEGIVRISSLADRLAVTGVFDHALIFIEEHRTMYEFNSNSVIPDDNTKILTTSYGGDTRWIGIAGQYNYYAGGSTPIWEGTYEQLRTLVNSNSLTPLGHYVVTDYQTVHAVNTSVTRFNTDIATVPTERLMLQALTNSTFDSKAKCIDFSYEEGHYNILDDYMFYTDYDSSIQWNGVSGNSGTINVTILSSNSFSTDKRVGSEVPGFYLPVSDGTNYYEIVPENYDIVYTVVHGIDISTFTILQPINLNSTSAEIFREEYVYYGVKNRKGYLKYRSNTEKRLFDICDYRGVVVERYALNWMSYPAWLSTTTYNKNQIVRQGSGLYACLINGSLNRNPALTGGSFHWVRICLPGLSNANLYTAYAPYSAINIGRYSISVNTGSMLPCFRFCDDSGQFITATAFNTASTLRNITIGFPAQGLNSDNIDYNVFYRPQNVYNSVISGSNNTFYQYLRNSIIESVASSHIQQIDDSTVKNSFNTYFYDVQKVDAQQMNSCLISQLWESQCYGASSSSFYQSRYSSIESGCNFTDFSRPALYNKIGSGVANNHFNKIDYSTIGNLCTMNVIGAEITSCIFGNGTSNLSVAFGATAITGIDFSKANASTAARLAAPAIEGMRSWDITLKALFMYNGTSWERISTQSGENQSITGPDYIANNYTIQYTSRIQNFIAATTGIRRSITLPNTASYPIGRIITIKLVDEGRLDVRRQGTNLIDGSADVKTLFEKNEAITLFNSADGWMVTSAKNNRSGAFFPSITVISNIASDGTYQGLFTKTDFNVIANGHVDLQAVSTSLPIEFGLTLPISVQLGILNVEDVSGMIIQPHTGKTGYIEYNIASGIAYVNIPSVSDLISRPWYYQFQYLVE